MEKCGLKHVKHPYIVVLVSYDQPFISHLSGITYYFCLVLYLLVYYLEVIITN
jgi:hypothetical protein